MRLKDTLSRQLVTIRPDRDQPVKIYSCGPTVYDYPHIGNWYSFLRWDLLVRSLKAEGLPTLWVMNITDVGHLISDADDGEDKIEKKASKERKTAQEIAAFYGEYFLEGLRRLNFLTPDHLPKASEYVTEQIALVERLEKHGLTYLIDDGLYYDTAQWPEYGKLAQTDRRGLQPGIRVDFNPQKRNPTDFALWKLTPDGQKKDQEWESPWGRGSPGWHLECSAMSQSLLGLPIDIHTGGIDHIPIHHTNEIAQTEAAWGQGFAKIWLHSNFITIDGQKMSKSLNNFYTLEDIESRGCDLENLRLMVFSVRYSNQADFNWAGLEAAAKRQRRLKALAGRIFQLQEGSGRLSEHRQLLEKTLAGVKESLADDLNSPLALERLEQITGQLATVRLDAELRPQLLAFCQGIDRLLGLRLAETGDIDDECRELLQRRQRAREGEDFSAADRIRNELESRRIAILDGEFGQIWQPL